MLKNLLLAGFAISVITVTPSCNSNKIACPTYADSFPEKSGKKKKKPQPEVPKASKAKSSVMPGGKRDRNTQ